MGHIAFVLYTSTTALNTGRVTNLSRIVRQGYKHSTYILCCCVQHDKMLCPFLSFFLFRVSAIYWTYWTIMLLHCYCCYYTITAKILHNHHHHRQPCTKNQYSAMNTINLFVLYTMHVISFILVPNQTIIYHRCTKTVTVYQYKWCTPAAHDDGGLFIQ